MRFFPALRRESIGAPNGSVPILYNQTAGSVLGWFRKSFTSNNGGVFRQNPSSGNAGVRLFSAVGGQFNITWRTNAVDVSFTSSTVATDGRWHRFLLVRRNSSPFVEFYLDGVSDGSSTTDPGTESTAVNGTVWSAINGTAGLGGYLHRCAFLAGTTLTAAEADTFLMTGTSPYRFSQYFEMDSPASYVEQDRTGLGNNGTDLRANTNMAPPALYIPPAPFNMRVPYTPFGLGGV